jgi:hypothetical protein
MPASLDELKTAYRKQISKWHPDRFHTASEIRIATQKSQDINESFLWLTEYADGLKLGSQKKQEAPRPTYSYRSYVFSPGFPDRNVFEHFLKSSNIISIGYRADKLILYVKFHRTAVYRYFDVPKKTFEDFLIAPSPGRYRNSTLDSYKFERCNEPNVPYEPDPHVLLGDRLVSEGLTIKVNR